VERDLHRFVALPGFEKARRKGTSGNVEWLQAGNGHSQQAQQANFEQHGLGGR